MNYDKAIIRVPLEQYAYIEVEASGDESSLIEQYRAIAGAFKGGDGLPVAQYESFVQRQLEGQGNSQEEYEKMSPQQQETVQLVKRLKKRIAYKITKTKEE